MPPPTFNDPFGEGRPQVVAGRAILPPQHNLGLQPGSRGSPWRPPQGSAHVSYRNGTMTSQSLQDQPRLGATFYPGGEDDFQMPELISPSPQRLMPEVPSNIQEGLAHLELEANEPRLELDSNEIKDRNRMSSVSTVSSLNDNYDNLRPSPLSPVKSDWASRGPASSMGSYGQTATVTHQNTHNNMTPTQNNQYRKNSSPHDIPFPSPWPKVDRTGANIPESAGEKEDILIRASSTVLSSTDPEVQLKWAEDALGWVEAAEDDRGRSSTSTNQRSATPRREKQLREDAKNIINFLADQEHPKALFLRGLWYEFGKFGYPLDKQESFTCYWKSAEKGYARAEYRIGTSYERLHDMDKAIEHYHLGASKGDSPSTYRLGMMTLLGQHDQPQDYQLGIDRIRFAADNADENAAQGAYVYGLLLVNELPHITIPESILPINVEEARHYIEKAAYLGFAKAQFRMGQAYELASLLCEFNPALSIHYMVLAARQCEAEAEMGISKWYLCGYEGVFEKNEEIAFEYAQRATQSGLANAQFALGYFYEVGIHVKKDLEQAEIWYKKAADQGSQEAISRLKGLQQHEIMSRKDHERVAISRIKSTYGSQRGKRPERFKERRSPLPVMAEERIEIPDAQPPVPEKQPIPRSRAGSAAVMPEPPPKIETQPVRHSRAGSGNTMPEPPNVRQSRAASGSGLMSPPQQGSLPPRSKSTAPYPEDDIAPGPRMNQRPTSSQTLQPLAGPVADRPGSAFGIRPPPPHGMTQGQPPNIRPATSMGNVSVPVGRGANPDPRARMSSAGWEPQVPPTYGRKVSPTRPPTVPQMEPPRPAPAPYDNAQAGRTRLQKPGPGAKPQPPLPQPPMPSKEPVYPITPIDERKPTLPVLDTRYDSLPPKPMPQPYDRRPAEVKPLNIQRPPRMESLPPPGPSHQRVPSGSTNPLSPPSRPTSQGSSATPPQSTPSAPAPSSSQPKPPKTGPKTFEEMGIPQHKKEGECSIM